MLTEIPTVQEPIILWNSGSRVVELFHEGKVFGTAEEFVPLKEGRAGASFSLITLRGPDVIHHHNVGEEIYVLWRGEGKIFLNDEILPFTRGTGIRIPPGALHAAKPDGSHELEFWCISIPPFNPDDVIYNRRGQRW
ncbi:MAG: AraC family ligand binding domain-containing protein [Candidatus Pacebacteria bacterium]|nr:AraC family ligand binding domain-containing protein [Candidatus Paceibacterota bacterium]